MKRNQVNRMCGVVVFHRTFWTQSTWMVNSSEIRRDFHSICRRAIFWNLFECDFIVVTVVQFNFVLSHPLRTLTPHHSLKVSPLDDLVKFRNFWSFAGNIKAGKPAYPVLEHLKTCQKHSWNFHFLRVWPWESLMFFWLERTRKN
jgi:hypothetical protein